MLGDRGTGEGGAGMGQGPGKGSRFFDDLAGMAGGAFSALSGLRAEIESNVRSQVETVIQRLELVRREELDAAMEVARRAREESEALAARVAALEARLAAGSSPFTGEPGWAAGATAGESGGAVGTDTPAVGASVADADTLRGSGGSGTGPTAAATGRAGTGATPSVDPGTGGEGGGSGGN